MISQTNGDMRKSARNDLKVSKLLGQEGNKPFKCSECEKAFFTKQYMKVHKKKFHNQNDAY